MPHFTYSDLVLLLGRQPEPGCIERTEANADVFDRALADGQIAPIAPGDGITEHMLTMDGLQDAIVVLMHDVVLWERAFTQFSTTLNKQNELMIELSKRVTTHDEWVTRQLDNHEDRLDAIEAVIIP